ncbi:MAG TPA: hypothetical protein PLI62_09835 [Spirochaetota bacterium]|nr:hypothetical protein [Spirochaetota bacterium]HQP50228.1 hypothetical protein [Spirochaetota bacterium]
MNDILRGCVRFGGLLLGLWLVSQLGSLCAFIVVVIILWCALNFFS